MKTRNLSNAMIVAGVLIAMALILSPMLAHATGTPTTPSANSAASSSANAAAHANATAGSAIDLSLMNAPAGASIRQGDSWALAAPASAAALPPGLCPKGDSEAYSVIWGLVSWSKSSTRTEMECLDKVLQAWRDTAPKPAANPTVINYLTPSEPQEAKPEPKPNTQACIVPPAPKKPIAPKKHVVKPKQCG